MPTTTPAISSTEPLTQRKIFWFWLPLLSSWLLLTMEGPLISTVVNRLPDAVVMLAAQGLVISLSVFIESPVINLLSTSTAKVKDRQSYEMVRRFTIQLIVALTVLTVAFGYTPLFDWLIIDGMGIDLTVAEWVRRGMKLMVFWTAAIGWRRFLQGVLIAFGRTQAIMRGTMIRLFSQIATAVGGALLTDLPGVIIAALTWMVGVTIEAIYASYAVKPILKNDLPDALPHPHQPLTYSELFWFHLPLAGTSVLALMVQPMAAYSLSRLADPVLSLAAWPLLFQVLLVARAPSLAVPELTIALNKDEASYVALRRFILTMAAVTMALFALFALSPLRDFYLDVIQRADAEVSKLVVFGLVLSLFFPVLNVGINGLRGFMISNQNTRSVNTGMTINILSTIALLVGGVQLQWSGIGTAVLAVNIATAIELLYLFYTLRSQRLQMAFAASQTA